MIHQNAPEKVSLGQGTLVDVYNNPSYRSGDGWVSRIETVSVRNWSTTTQFLATYRRILVPLNKTIAIIYYVINIFEI